MFKLSYLQYGNTFASSYDDINDLRDALINIVNDEKEEELAYNWCCKADFGDKLERSLYVIECISETELQKLGQQVANQITKDTGIKNRFRGIRDNELIWEFNYKTTTMSLSIVNDRFYFITQSSNFSGCCHENKNEPKKFIESVESKLRMAGAYTPKEKPFSKRNDVIIKAVIDLVSYNKAGQLPVYNDGCWYIDLERCPNGTLRFWVGYEDKRTYQCNGSICSVHSYNGQIRCAADFPLKSKVKNKVISVYKELQKQGLVER